MPNATNNKTNSANNKRGTKNNAANNQRGRNANRGSGSGKRDVSPISAFIERALSTVKGAAHGAADRGIHLADGIMTRVTGGRAKKTANRGVNGMKKGIGATVNSDAAHRVANAGTYAVDTVYEKVLKGGDDAYTHAALAGADKTMSVLIRENSFGQRLAKRSVSGMDSLMSMITKGPGVVSKKGMAILDEVEGVIKGKTGPVVAKLQAFIDHLRPKEPSL